MVATTWQKCIGYFSHQLFSLRRYAGMGQTLTPPTLDLSDEVTTLLPFCDFAWPKGLACFAHVGFASVCAFLVANDGNCSAALLCFCPASVVKAARLGLVGHPEIQSPRSELRSTKSQFSWFFAQDQEQQQLPLETNVTKMAPTFSHKLQIQQASGYNAAIKSDGANRTGYPFVVHT